MENAVNEEELQVIIDADEGPESEARFVRYLREYNRQWGWEWQGRRRENTPFSILVADSQNNLRDIDELWADSNGLEYLSRLLDNNQEMVNLIYERTPRGVEGFRYVLKFLFLYNMSRIHKIVERDAEGPVYEDEANTIFQHCHAGNIIYDNTGAFTNYDRHLLNIMNNEASLLVPDNLEHANEVHPFDGRSVLQEETGLFYRIFKNQFHLFVNRVSLRFYKALRRFGLRNAPRRLRNVQQAPPFGHLFRGGGVNTAIRNSRSRSGSKTKSRKSSLKNILSSQVRYLSKVKIFNKYVLKASINLPPDVKYLKSSKPASMKKNKNPKLTKLIKETPKNPEYSKSMKQMINGYKVIDNSYTLNGAEIGKGSLFAKDMLKISRK